MCCLFLLWGIGNSTEELANKSSVERPIWARVSKAGLFRVVRSGGVVDTPGSSTGKSISKPVIELVRITDQIPIFKDAHMSLQYRIGAIPEGVHWLDLRRVLKHPEMTLPDGSTTTGSDYMIREKVSVRHVIAYTGYGLNEDYEMVEGDWTFEIWLDDRKLIEQAFTTYWPDEVELAELVPEV